AQKALLDEGDAAASNLARSLGLECAKLAANQMKVLQSIGFNIFFKTEDMNELSDILPISTWETLSYASFVEKEPAQISINTFQCFDNNVSPYFPYNYYMIPLQPAYYSPQNFVLCQTSEGQYSQQQEIQKPKWVLVYI
ncbi:MAG: hypothetical protein EZS28_025308, partial [Streblomastix strix]